LLSFSPCLALRPRDSTLCGTPDCNVPTGDSDSRRPESRQYILTGSICRIAVSRPPLSACRFIRVVRCVSLVTTLTRTRTLTLNNVGVRVGALSRRWGGFSLHIGRIRGRSNPDSTPIPDPNSTWQPTSDPVSAVFTLERSARRSRNGRAEHRKVCFW
jgi:hypothetical protein